MWRVLKLFRRRAVSVTQHQVIEALKRVRSPRGVSLPEAGVLSPITANDG